MRSPSAAALVVAVTLAGCSERAASTSQDDGLCSTVLRLPSNDVEVMTLGDDGRPVVVPASCAKVGCLRARRDAVAVVQPDGTIWAAWEGRPGGVLDASIAEDASPVERWVRAQAVVAQTGVDVGPRGLAPPVLPKELRTCGTTEAGGGYGWHVIQNDGDVWQRIHWGAQPVAPEVRALAADAYPLATETGALCAIAVQEQPRNWRVQLVPSGKIVVAAPDHEHPPARCTSGGAVEVRRADGLYRYGGDGSELKVDEPQGSDASTTQQRMRADVFVEGTANVARPVGPLYIHDVDGRVRELPLPVNHDLAGRPLPPGAVRERLLAAGDGASTLLVVERIQRADCTVNELVHLVHQDAVTPIASGDVVVAKPVFAAGRFYWLEARPQIVDLARD